MTNLIRTLILTCVIISAVAGHTDALDARNGRYTEKFSFPQRSLLQSCVRALESETSVLNKLSSVSHHIGSLDPIEDWMRRFHGLKISLVGGREYLPMLNVTMFFDAILESRRGNRLEFQALSEFLRAMNKTEQLELFLELKDQVEYGAPSPRSADGRAFVGAGRVLLQAANKAEAEKLGLLQTYKAIKAQIDATAQAEFINNDYPPIYTELFSAFRAGKIRLDVDGTIPYGIEGIPDRDTYELAVRIGDYHRIVSGNTKKHDAQFRLLPPEQQRLVQAMIDAPQLTLQRSLTDPHNSQLLKIRYTELVTGLVNAPLWRYLDTSNGIARYQGSPRGDETGWWAPLSVYETGSISPSRITAETTRDFAVKEMYGPELERVVIWPRGARTPSDRTSPDLTRVRIIENRNRITKELYSVQVLANHAAGEPPMGFFLVNIGGHLVPAKTFHNEAVERACIHCHAGQDGKMSFKPKQFTSPDAVSAIGFHDRFLIHKLMSGN